MENYDKIITAIIDGNFSEARRLLQDKLRSAPNDQTAQKLVKVLLSNDAIQFEENTNLKMLNLGCGYHYHPDWVNVDFVKTGPTVISYNLLMGIPFDDNTFDVVYHSHLLEHFPKRYAPVFIKECYRILKPGGVIRVVVPNLEGIIKEYLTNLEKALSGDEEAKNRYEWILLELFDQMVRNKSGGEMLEYWKQYPLPSEDYIIQRLGSEAKKNIDAIRKQRTTITPNEYKNKKYEHFDNPIEIGKFRLSGEIHQWMYDRYSLGKLLEEAGFVEVRVCMANESKIPNFNNYLLDIEPDGSTRKPDSLFMEAIKPSTEKKSSQIVSSSLEENFNPLNLLEKKLKVVHLSTFDTGGAGIAALRLHLGLLKLGVESYFLTLHKQTNFPNVLEVKKKPFAKDWNWNKYASQWYQVLYKEYPNRPKDLEIFTSIKSIADLKDNQLIKDADVVNFHWVSSLVDFVEDLDIFKGKKIVWTLHDENAFTGGCHYTSGCRKYIEECAKCPQLQSNIEGDLSNIQFKYKRQFCNDLNLTIVTPSNWLYRNVKQSLILKQKKAFCIHYGLPTGVFRLYDKVIVRNLLNLSQDKFIILFGAEYQNKRKGFHFIKEFVELCPREIDGKYVELLIFGNISQLQLKSKIPIKLTGGVKNPIQLAMLYSAADVFLMFSTEDNLPNTAIESICCGTPVVAFNVGGLSDIVEHKKNGWLANPFELEDIIEGIGFASTITQTDREIISARAQEKFNEFSQAFNYLKLYTSLIEDKEFKNNDVFPSRYLFNPEFSVESLQFILLNKLHSVNFSGLDFAYFNRIETLEKISSSSFFQLFVIKLLNSLYFDIRNFLFFISNKNSTAIELLPALFRDCSIMLVNFEQNKLFWEKENNKTRLIVASVDRIETVFEQLTPAIICALFDFQEFKTFMVSIEKSFTFRIPINFMTKAYFIVKYDLNELDNIEKELERIIPNQQGKIFLNMNAEIEKERKLFIFDENGNNKGLFLLGIDLFEIFKHKIKNIHFIRNYNKEYPKISIVTPNLNQGKYIEICIQSIINQEYPNLEYIIIDGGSTDNSIETIKKYEKKIHYWVSEKDNGQYDAINKGFSLATGDILAWLNADDFYLPGALYFVAEFFTAFTEAQWITTSMTTTLSIAGSLQTDWFNKTYTLEKILKGKYDDPFIQQESTFWLRGLWERAGSSVSTNYSMASDLELWIRFFKLTNLYTLECPIAVFRFQPESKTGKGYQKYLDEANQIINDYNSSLRRYTNQESIGKSINITLKNFIEKSGLNLVRNHLEKIISDYENLNFKAQSRSYKNNIEKWIKILKLIKENLN